MSGCFTKVFLFSVWFAFTGIGTSMAGQNTLIIEADEWCPINCEPGSREGIGIDLAKKIFEPLGYKIQYVIVPWTQALRDVRLGKVHAVVGANHRDDESLVFPGIALLTITDDFFVREGSNWQYQGIHTLKNKRVGVIESYGYGDVVTQFMQQNRNNIRTLHVGTGNNPLIDNVEKLINAKLDIVVENKGVMENALRNYEKRDKIKWAGGVPQAPVYLAFSPAHSDSKKLAAYYDTAIRKMRQDGSLKAMYAKYGLTAE